MKNNYFQKIEDKYVFNLSRIFWHIFIALGTLAIVAGLAAFIYSVTPTFKKKVAKETYPPEIRVELSDIQEQKPVAAQPQAQTQTPAVVTTTPAAPANDPDKPQYDALIIQLQTLIPPTKYSWAGTGHYEYPWGESYWNYYKQDKYRVWVVTGGGVLDNLNTAYDRTDAYSYKKKVQLLSSYLSIIRPISEPDRLNWLNYLMDNTGNNFSSVVELFGKIGHLAPKFTGNAPQYISTLIEFKRSNKNDGMPFIDMVDSVISGFESSQRSDIVDRLKDAFYIYFNNKVDKQLSATRGFLPLSPYFHGEQQGKALTRYYKVYIGKNADREQQISEIENKYQLEQGKAQLEYQTSKLKKDKLSITSLGGIGAAVAFISVLAILLVFLSIQRSVRNMEDKMIAAPAVPKNPEAVIPLMKGVCKNCGIVNKTENMFCENCGNKIE